MSQNSQENTCVRPSVLIKLQAEAENVAQVFSCEFCEIFKNTFFTEHLWATVSEYIKALILDTKSLFHYFSVSTYNHWENVLKEVICMDYSKCF